MEEIRTAEAWIAALGRYAELVRESRPQRLRLAGAALDGAWCRLEAHNRAAMVEALGRVNEALPEDLQLGFVNTRTGQWYGRPREVAPLLPSRA